MTGNYKLHEGLVEMITESFVHAGINKDYCKIAVPEIQGKGIMIIRNFNTKLQDALDELSCEGIDLLVDSLDNDRLMYLIDLAQEEASVRGIVDEGHEAELIVEQGSQEITHCIDIVQGIQFIIQKLAADPDFAKLLGYGAEKGMKCVKLISEDDLKLACELLGKEMKDRGMAGI